jgi:hypothetical protein
MDLESKRPTWPLFRVGRDDDAWAIPDWGLCQGRQNLRKSIRRPDGRLQGPVRVIATPRMFC